MSGIFSCYLLNFSYCCSSLVCFSNPTLFHCATFLFFLDQSSQECLSFVPVSVQNQFQLEVTPPPALSYCPQSEALVLRFSVTPITSPFLAAGWGEGEGTACQLSAQALSLGLPLSPFFIPLNTAYVLRIWNSHLQPSLSLELQTCKFNDPLKIST